MVTLRRVPYVGYCRCVAENRDHSKEQSQIITLVPTDLGGMQTGRALTNNKYTLSSVLSCS